MNIYKPPEAKTNTYFACIRGTSIFPATSKGQAVNAEVRFTSDAAGETLSVFDPSTKKQIVLPFEDVWKLIQRARETRP